MTWSYEPTLLEQNKTKSGIYAVRFLIGDVVQCDGQMQDEEIAFAISLRGTLYGAAAECCRALSAKFSRSVDQSGGTNKILYSQMAKAYLTKANEFEKKSSFSAVPTAGGLSVTNKQMEEMTADRVSPEFIKGMTDNHLPEPSIGTNAEALLNRN